jgi:hypothetical protein
LLYLAVVTRPDISFAVGLVARFIERHDTSHVNAVRRIIAYLKGTSNFGIRFVGFGAIHLLVTPMRIMLVVMTQDSQQRAVFLSTTEGQLRGRAVVKRA